MRFYEPSPEDIGLYIGRCHFEAKHHRVALALARLGELADLFGPNVDILYAEGTIRRDSLGQGIATRRLFEEAYHLAVATGVYNNVRWVCATNCALLAPDEQEFRRWVEIAYDEIPQGNDARRELARQRDALAAGFHYRDLLIGRANVEYESHDYGTYAAIIEMALLAETSPDDELIMRRNRALRLRDLDRDAHEYRQTIAEWYPAKERDSLREALQEIDRAIVLDEHDPTLWNYKAAWLCLLGRYEEALPCADQAIYLRPHHYPEPHRNRNLALQALNLNSENVPHDLDLADFESRFTIMMSAAKLCSEQELGRIRTDIDMGMLVDRLINHYFLVRGNPSLGYVPMMAEILTDFTPETVFLAILEVGKRNGPLCNPIFDAELYLIAHAEGVLQRDSARLMVLSLLNAPDAVSIRRNYRMAILEPSAAATGAMSRLDAIMREELARISPALPALIAD